MKKHKAKKHSQKGFSLIELLIVVAIILIIAAIAIPNLLRSRMAANEASAVGSLRTINTAEVTYSSTYPGTGFTDTLTSLGPSGVNMIDSVLASGTKSGYTFAAPTTSGGTPAVLYSTTATPATPNSTGV